MSDPKKAVESVRYQVCQKYGYDMEIKGLKITKDGLVEEVVLERVPVRREEPFCTLLEDDPKKVLAALIKAKEDVRLRWFGKPEWKAESPDGVKGYGETDLLAAAELSTKLSTELPYGTLIVSAHSLTLFGWLDRTGNPCTPQYDRDCMAY